MNQSRLPFLLIVTGAIFGGGFGLFLLATNLYEGITERQEKITKLQADGLSADLRLARFLKMKRQVDSVRSTALPGNVAVATNVYKGFLRELLLKNKFEVKQFTDQANMTRTAITPGARGQQGPTVNVITCTVTAEVTLEHLVNFLQDFYRFNIPHEIRGFTVVPLGKGNEAKLAVEMKVDVLSISGVPDRESVFAVPTVPVSAWETIAALGRAPTGLAVGLSQFAPAGLYGGAKLASLAHPHRVYRGMLDKNVLSGLVARESLPSKDAGPKPDYAILKDTSLMSITANNIAEKAELRVWPTNKYVSLRAEGGVNAFEVKDANNKVVLKGKVLLIKPRDVVFESAGKVYIVHVGQKLDDAMKRELTSEDLKSIDPELVTAVRDRVVSEPDKEDSDKQAEEEDRNE